MSRSGYTDEIDDQWQNIMWRGAVNSALKGERGQRFLRELLEALDAMPEKRLVDGELEADGQFCALGVVGHARGLNLASIDTYDTESLSGTFNIAEAMAREIMYMNDEAVTAFEYVRTGDPYPNEWKRIEVADSGEKRWRIVRDWVAASIKTKEQKT